MAPERSLPLALPSVASPDGALVASVHPGRLIVRSASTCSIIATYKLPSDSVTRCKHIRWSRLSSATQGASQAEDEDWLGTKPESSCRLLLADDDNIRVYDPTDPTWKATISSASSNLGSIADVAFGFSAGQVLVFSDFGVKLTIWSLLTSRGVEIRDPKYGISCYDFRPKSGHLALLTRATTQDVMLLLKPTTNEVMRSVELGTVDAQEISWSKDGKWIAVIDAASAGHKILIYTADGQLFRTWAGKTGPVIQLGIKSLAWTEAALVVGDYNDEVTLLKKDTFTELGTFMHLPTISSTDRGSQTCWEEQINASKERSYAKALQAVNPPTSESFTKSNRSPKHGVSTIAINVNDSMLATKSDSWPTAIWIWSLATGTLVATLIHHSPVKHMKWHPTTYDLLLIHCSVPEPVVHVWKGTWDTPHILSVPLDRAVGRLEASWLQTAASSAPSSSSGDIAANIMLSSSQQYVTAQISLLDGTYIAPPPTSVDMPEGAAARSTDSAGPEDMFDEGHSLDFSPVKITNGTVDVGMGYDVEGFGMTGEGVDDTFHYRKNVKAGG